MKIYATQEAEQLFKEACTEAIGRFETLKEFCFYAREETEPEVNITDALKIQAMTENAAKFIAEQLNDFLAAHGVHVAGDSANDAKEAC